MQFTKEAQELAKPCCEAIKKISKGKWEWRPRYRDACLRKRGYPGICTVLIYDPLGGQVKITRGFGRAKWVPADDIIPLLHWEKIEEILEGMGWSKFKFSFSINGTVEARSHKTVSKPDTSDWIKLCSGTGKSRQEAVTWAVIKLGKSRKEE